MPRIQRQAEQFPTRSTPYSDYGPEENDWEAQREHEEHQPAPEHEVDDWPDPDHGREDRYAAQDPAPVIKRDDIKIMRGEDSGLYGEDEDDTYDAVVRPSPRGNGYDVLKPL